MADQTREALERLLGAADGLIADMRQRAIMRGDYEIEGGKKIATLDCGNSVLFGIDGARVAAREALASAQQAGPAGVPWMQPHDLLWMVESLKLACLLVKREQRNEEIRKVLHALEVEILNLPPAAPVVPEEWRQAVAGLVDDIDGLICESSGVCGLHLNGDMAPWSDLTEGGRFERLTRLEAVRALLAAPAPEQREPVALTAGALKIGDHYNWKGQPERLVYLGREGRWHQFAKVDEPRQIWSEVLSEDMYMLEESPEAGTNAKQKGGAA